MYPGTPGYRIRTAARKETAEIDAMIKSESNTLFFLIVAFIIGFIIILIGISIKEGELLTPITLIGAGWVVISFLIMIIKKI